MASTSLMPLKESPSSTRHAHKAFHNGLPQTIDPLCIDNRHFFSDIKNEGQDIASMTDGSQIHQQHALVPYHPQQQLSALSTTPGPASRRPSLMLEQTSPHYSTGPLSASSSFGSSVASSQGSGMLTPYTSSSTTSACSSRRDSLIHTDHPRTYVVSCQGSPSPQAHEARSFGMEACLSAGPTYSPHYAYGDTMSFGEPDNQFAYKREPMLPFTHSSQAFFQELSNAEGNTLTRRASADATMTDFPQAHFHSGFGPSFAAPDFHAMHQVPRVHQLQPAPELNESDSLSHSWMADSMDMNSASSSPTWSEPGFPIMSAPRTPVSRSVRTRDDYRVSKSVRPQRRVPARIVDAGAFDIQDRTHRKQTKAQTPFACKYEGCHMRFGRPEHCNRHQMTHDPAGKEVRCPLCNKGIKQRRDNLKAHIVRTHFTPAEKKKTEKMNERYTLKRIFERLQNPSTLDPQEQALWLDVFKKPSEDDLLGHRPSSTSRVAPSEIWPRVREMDVRFARLLSGKMTIHDKEKAKGDKEGTESGKSTKFWKMLGWSIAETQSILVTDVMSDWDGHHLTTLWDLDPRRKALLDGSLTLEDAKEHLGVNMFKSREMGLEHIDPRWIALHAGQMSFEESEELGVRSLNSQWNMKSQKSRRSKI